MHRKPTWYSFPPAATSRAVVATGSFSRTRRATTPLYPGPVEAALGVPVAELQA